MTEGPTNHLRAKDQPQVEFDAERDVIAPTTSGYPLHDMLKGTEDSVFADFAKALRGGGKNIKWAK